MNNDTVTDQIWPIIANPEALAVNQAWYGSAGGVFASGTSMVDLGGSYGAVPNYQAWYKPLSANSVAVLIMNHQSTAQSITINIGSIPGLSGSTSYSARDIFNHVPLGNVQGTYTATNLASHDSVFMTLSW